MSDFNEEESKTGTVGQHKEMSDMGGYKPPSYPDVSSDKNSNPFDYSLCDIQSTKSESDHPTIMTYAPTQFQFPPTATPVHLKVNSEEDA